MFYRGARLKAAAVLIAAACTSVSLRAQTVWAQGKSVRVPVPRGFLWNQAITAKGGPIALTFGKMQYANGGILPLNGAEIDVTETDPPPSGLADLIRQELLNDPSIQMQEAASVGGIRVSYLATFTPELKYSSVAYYVTRGSTLYKFFLSYIAGDSGDQALVSDFDGMVARSQFGAAKAKWLRFFETPVAHAAGSPAFAFDQTAPGAAQLDGYFGKKSSPLQGSGEDFVRLGKQYNVDPRLIAAIAGGETTFGKHVCAKNNAWNWFHRRTCPPSVFTSYAEGIDRVSKFMRLSYINKGYDTIEKIRFKYCATGCDNWIRLITLFHNEMPVSAPASASPPVSKPISPPATAPGPPAPVRTGAAKAPPPPANPARLFGVPLFALFYVGAAAVANMMLKLLGRAG